MHPHTTQPRTSTSIILHTKCRMCDKSYHFIVSIEGYTSWINGALIQNALPDLTIDDRELLISGTCPSCWESLFGSGDDDWEPDMSCGQEDM